MAPTSSNICLFIMYIVGNTTCSPKASEMRKAPASRVGGKKRNMSPAGMKNVSIVASMK